GDIDMMVGVDSDGNVTGVSIVSLKETAGLGAKASEPDFTNQFVGKAGSVSVNKDGGEIVALTSSTITSRAVCDGVNSALNAVKEVG
ncbi:MAG: FMN-binding protein, partial [Oscillospiraceae bacterium]|nr:FMN-binding protein [Oscillospiraceae bacterium]